MLVEKGMLHILVPTNEKRKNQERILYISQTGPKVFSFFLLIFYEEECSFLFMWL